MTVERREHPEPDVAWAALEEFINKFVEIPDGSPPSAAVLKVLCFGAWIGCRLSTIFPSFGLAVAEYGNAQSDDKVMAHTSKMFSEVYMPWLQANMENYLHNLGFSAIRILPVPGDAASPAPDTTGITDTDVLDIMKGLDDFGKEKA